MTTTRHPTSLTDAAMVKAVYEKMRTRVAEAREHYGRALTLSEKILYSHLDNPKTASIERGVDYADYRPDRVAMQDATAQMAVLQFMVSGREEVAVPTTVHCDHLIQAFVGADKDLAEARVTNKEVYDFLKDASARYGMGFWRPGAGIIHQVVLENYAFPGGMMIGTDSHTPNAGGLGMVAIGVGGADAVDVMVGMPWNLKVPKLIGVELTGTLSGWTASKDVILKVADTISAKGGTGAIVEYFGPGARDISCTGKGTICNMGAEIGATTSIFEYGEKMGEFLRLTDRADLADLADEYKDLLVNDDEVEADPEKYYDQVIRINLDELAPMVVGPFTPDRAHELGSMTETAKKEEWPLELSSALIGSCTNSSYEDITRIVSIAKQAAAHGVKTKTPLLITPGSEQIRQTIERDGLLGELESIGGKVLANACGPCIGQWKRSDVEKGERNTIVNSFNRNFPKRNDGNPSTLAFVGSPETVIALALAGRLDFDPRKDTLTAADGTEFTLDEPQGVQLPESFQGAGVGFDPPAENADPVTVSPSSDRIQELEAFPKWDGNDYEKLPILMKAQGKCTTDHISMAGPWLKYRGHLENISGNLFNGVENEFSAGEAGTGFDQFADDEVVPLPDLAKRWHEAGRQWVAIGDENYGEGSSREHAAMEPRFRGCVVVIVRSFARIHETNLKKQGIIPLTFADPADYDKVRKGDAVTVHDLAELAPGKAVSVTLTHTDGTEDTFACNHTLSDEQIKWFHAGSALNLIKQTLAG